MMRRARRSWMVKAKERMKRTSSSSGVELVQSPLRRTRMRRTRMMRKRKMSISSR